jgi:hypothetical protein
MTSLIYILRLDGGYYYVGRTSDLAARYEEHLTGEGSVWTTLHRPVSIERTLPETSPFDEDKTTKELMAQYGIDRVRGGSYCQENLSTTQIAALQVELRTATGGCFNCGKSGHYAKDCPIITRSISTETTYRTKPVAAACYRCGRTGHLVADCYASKDINGEGIMDDSDSYEDDSEDDYDDDDDSE